MKLVKQTIFPLKSTEINLSIISNIINQSHFSVIRAPKNTRAVYSSRNHSWRRVLLVLVPDQDWLHVPTVGYVYLIFGRNHENPKGGHRNLQMTAKMSHLWPFRDDTMVCLAWHTVPPGSTTLKETQGS